MSSRQTGNGVSREGGDANIAAVGALIADPGRSRILLALGDGRALPASRLAAEAGVTPATASSHLRKLTEGGLLSVESHGRYRYYRLAGAEVAELIETLERLSPTQPIRSLRDGTRARALRDARTCYDHVAGRLGVELMAAMIRAGHVTGGDGHHRPSSGDPRAGFGHELEYALTPAGEAFLQRFGAVIPPRRRRVRYCVDWTEQRHHLSGGVGRALRDRMLELAWIEPASSSRAVRVTPAGERGLREAFGLGDAADPDQPTAAIFEP